MGEKAGHILSTIKNNLKTKQNIQGLGQAIRWMVVTTFKQFPSSVFSSLHCTLIDLSPYQHHSTRKTVLIKVAIQ